MKRLKIITSILLLTFMTGCSTQRQTATTEEVDPTEVVADMKNLEDGKFYILHVGKYYPLYEGVASFDRDRIASYTDDSRNLYFNDDWDNIPTMYMGDSLIYYTNENLEETVTFERFEDFGYSIGITNLSRLDSGRYAFDATEEKSEDNTYINPNSDASRLLELNMSQVIIDNIGGAQLRSGNISRGGSIMGLEKDRLYSTDVYVGTNLKNYILKADTRILTSMEVTEVTNYSFLRSKILEVYIPQNFNSGYYRVDNVGVFRYVVGTSYSDNTDFNVPNVDLEEMLEADNPEMHLDDTHDSLETKSFTINQETDVMVTFTFQDSESVEYDLDDPVVKLIGPDMSYTLSEYDNNTQQIDVHLMPGQYNLEITGLHGRQYDFKVTKQ